jgi:hypothetical protein
VIRQLAGSIWIRLLITAAVLVPLLARVDLAATAAALRRLDPMLAAAVVGLLAVDRAIMIWRWVVLLRARGNTLSVADATQIFLVTSFVGTAVALAGDAARAYALSRRNAKGSEALASVAVDRMLGLLALVAIGLVGIAMAGARSSERSDLAFAATAILLAVATWATLSADRWVPAVLPASWHATPIGGQLLRLANSLAAYRGHRTALVVVLALSVAVQFQRILQAYLLGLAIGIDTVPFSYYLLALPPGLVALMLPISVAGFGAPQGLIVWLLQPRGVPVPDALALSTLIVLSGIVANLPGALIWLFDRRARV